MKFVFLIIITMSYTSIFAQDIDLKTGLYKVKSTMTVDGKIYDPLAEIKKQMANIPAEMRAQIMKNMGHAPNISSAQEHCITKENLKYESFVKSMESQQGCEHTFTKKTKTEIQTKVVCKDGTKSTMITKIINPTHYTFSADGLIAGQKNSKVQSEGTWVSAQCPKKPMK